MSPLGIAPRDVLGLVREHRRAESERPHLLVSGILAEELARKLRADGDARAVRTAGPPEEAAALVHVTAGALTPDAEASLRAATRALVPVVVLQTGDASAELPYVLATDVLVCAPGKGFPVDELAELLAARLGPQGPALAAALPVLRGAVQERRAEEGAVVAGVLAATGGDEPRLPLLALGQARTLLDVARAQGAETAAGPREAAEAVGVPLAASVGAGLALRTLVRRLPLRTRLLDGAIAAAATYALATAFRRLGRR